MATSPQVRTYKRKVHIVLDTETLGLKPKSAIIDIGAVVALGPEQGVSYSQLINPQSYSGADFCIDQDTVAWHEQQNPGFVQTCRDTGVSFQEAAQSFVDWINQYKAEFDLHVWSQGKDFDFPLLNHLFDQCGHKSPFSYRNVHCTRDLLWLNPAARIRSNGEAAHTALADAECASQQLIAIVANSSWYQKLFK